MITENDLGEFLDTVNPFDLPRCRTTRDDVGSVWFHHPDFDHIVCKYGFDRKQRLLRIWMWEHKDKVLILTIGIASNREEELFKDLSRR